LGCNKFWSFSQPCPLILPTPQLHPTPNSHHKQQKCLMMVFVISVPQGGSAELLTSTTFPSSRIQSYLSADKAWASKQSGLSDSQWLAWNR